MAHDAPLKTNHLNCTGLAPPLVTAVKAMVFPAGCGAGRSVLSAVTLSLVVGATVGGGVVGSVVTVVVLVIAKATFRLELSFSAASMVEPALRAQTATL